MNTTVRSCAFPSALCGFARRELSPGPVRRDAHSLPAGKSARGMPRKAPPGDARPHESGDKSRKNSPYGQQKSPLFSLGGVFRRPPERPHAAPDPLRTGHPRPAKERLHPQGNGYTRKGTTAPREGMTTPARERLHPRGNDCAHERTTAPTRERLCPREIRLRPRGNDCAREGTTAPREGYEKAHSAPGGRNAKRMIIFRGAPYPECALPGMRPKRRGR